MKVVRNTFLASAVIMGLLILPLLFGITQQKDCSKQNCTSTRLQDAGKIFGQKEQSLSAKILMQGTTNLNENRFKDHLSRQIRVSSTIENRLLIEIPFRNTEQFYTYTTPINYKVSELSINIQNSRDLIILVNGKLAYTHSYPVSQFEYNPSDPIFVTKEIKSKITVEKNVINSPIFNYVFVMLFSILTLPVLMLIGVLFRSKNNVIKQKNFYSYLFILMLILWTITLVFWLRKPLTFEGNTNPSPFGSVGALFSDFFQIWNSSKFPRPYDLAAVNYPPTGLFILQLASKLVIGEYIFLLIIIFAFLVKYIFIKTGNVSVKDKEWLILVFLFSFPFIFGVSRGNLDVLVVAILICVILINGRLWYVSGFLFGIAIALKYWPIIFVFYFWKFMNKKMSIVAIITFLILSILSSHFLGYNLFYDFMSVARTTISSQDVSVSASTMAYSSSVYTLGLATYLFFTDPRPWDLTGDKIQNALIFMETHFIYVQFFLVAMCLFIFLYSKIRSSIWIACSIFVSLIPAVSYIYRLDIVIVGLFLLLEERNSVEISIKTPGKHFKFFVIALILLISPWNIFYMPESSISVGSVFIPLLQLTLLFILLARTPVPEKLKLKLYRQLQFLLK
jgi:hypothetical protein